MLKNNMIKGGIYIHVPFCKRKCVYCDFYSLPLKGCDTALYQHNLLCEIEIKAKEYPFCANTLFIGGGTPTVLDAAQLCQFVTKTREHFNLAPSAEVTIEANPGTITAHLAQALVVVGVNRLSLGVQAMQDHILKALGRVHNRNDVLQSIKHLQSAGIDNINTDLMCGLPDQTVTDLITSIREMIAAGVKHISLYPLQLEPGTPLHHQVKTGQVELPEDDLTLQMMQQASVELSRHGFDHYEIANYARPGYQCQHNLIYWHNEPYLGFGPAAASYYQQQRWVNKPDLNAYLASLGRPERVLDKDSRLKEIAMAETVFLGLRLLQEGLSRRRFYQRFAQNLDDVYQTQILDLVAKGWISDDGECIRLTPTGLPIANQVFITFL